jgi:hypothetical protein
MTKLGLLCWASGKQMGWSLGPLGLLYYLVARTTPIETATPPRVFDAPPHTLLCSAVLLAPLGQVVAPLATAGSRLCQLKVLPLYIDGRQRWPSLPMPCAVDTVREKGVAVQPRMPESRQQLPVGPVLLSFDSAISSSPLSDSEAIHSVCELGICGG